MQSVLKDPLVHFLLIGGLFFAVFVWRNDTPDPGRITITQDQLIELARTQTPIAGSDLSRAQLEALVEPAIREEVYYREALALGLDVDDDQVRTRLIEKMRYLTENLADPEPASEAELLAFFEADPARFLVPEAVSFEHVFLSPSQRGATIDADAAQLLLQLRGGESGENLGDRTPLGYLFDAATQPRLSVLFGEAMTEALFTLPLDAWHGPFESDFGLHLVRVRSRSAARQPAFAQVRDLVLDAFAVQRRQERNEAAFQQMRSRYDVTVEWPQRSAESQR